MSALNGNSKSSVTDLQKLVDAVPGLIYEFEMNMQTGAMRFSYLSKHVTELFEIDLEEGLQDVNKVFARIHPDDIQQVTAEVQEAAKNFEPCQQSYRVVLPKCGLRWYSSFITVESKSDHEIVMRGLITDITVMREREERAREANRLSEMGQQLATIVHEINNPLSVIEGTANLLKREIVSPTKDAATVIKRIERIEGMTKRINKIIVGLRNVSGKSSDNEWATANAADLIGDIGEIFEAKFKALQIEFNFHDFSNGGELRCQPVQISQVILNLLGNAADAVADLPERWIKVELHDIGNTLEFWFIDSGRGISDDVKAKIFDAFYTTKPIGKGTGLGLSVSFDIARKHGGSLSVDNHQGHTRFILTVPKKVA